MTAVIYNDGTQNTFTYDANHNPITMTDAMGGTATFEYDGALLVKMTDAAGSVYTFGYDAMGRRTSVTDPLGNTSKTVFDAAGRTVGEQRVHRIHLRRRGPCRGHHRPQRQPP